MSPSTMFESACEQTRGMRIGSRKSTSPKRLDQESPPRSRRRASSSQKGCVVRPREVAPHSATPLPQPTTSSPARPPAMSARFDGVRYAYPSSPATRRPPCPCTAPPAMPALATEVKSASSSAPSFSRGVYDAYLLEGPKSRTLVRRDFDAASPGRRICSPTSPTPAFKTRRKKRLGSRRPVLERRLYPARSSPCPACRIPRLQTPPVACPVGFQIVDPA